MLRTIDLQPEQRKVLDLPYDQPILLRGVAGCGKTTLAIYRAKHLIDNFVDKFDKKNVIIFTFNRTLIKYIDLLLRSIPSEVNNTNSYSFNNAGLNVETTTFHSWVSSNFIDCNIKVIKDQEQIDLVKEVRVDLNDFYMLILDTSFYIEEFAWIKGNLVETEEEYIGILRKGRGKEVVLTEKRRKILWAVYKRYEALKKEKNVIDFDDFTTIALKGKPREDICYSHIIVDEAQDMSKAQLLSISKYIDKSTNSITIIADSAQRIYKSFFSWKDIGIEGKSITFKRNYRSTIQISKAAQSLLNKEEEKEGFTKIDSARKGTHIPVIGYFESYDLQFDYLLSEIDGWMAKYEQIAILHNTNSGVRNFFVKLKEEGYNPFIINDRDSRFGKINLCTLKSIKGLEFDVVVIIDCNDRVLPSSYTNNGIDSELHISTERRTMYTAMTRAREELYMLASGKPSQFLNEIDINLVQVI